MPYYIEVDGKPVQVETLEEWAKWFETSDRTIRLTKIRMPGGGITACSTVFVGINSTTGSYPSYVYETAYITNYGTNHEAIHVFERQPSREQALHKHQQYIDTLVHLTETAYIVEDQVQNITKTKQDIDPLDRFEIID